MKFNFILLLNLLLLNISCKYIIGKDEEIKINDNLSDGIIYIKLDNFINTQNIYVKLNVNKGGIDSDIYIKFNDSETEDPNGFSKERYYNSVTISNSISKFYKINYKKYNYIILKYHLYSGGTSYPILTAKASDKDLGAEAMRNFFIIAGCVGGVILFLIIGVPIIRCVIKQKKVVNTGEVPNEITPNSYASSQESLVNNNDNSNNYNNNQQCYPEYPKSE